MAVITIDAVVNVAIHALVVLIGLRLLVTVGASEHREIVRVRVARRAHTIGSAVIRREPRVIEGRIQPVRCAVARITRRREPGCLVVRVGCAVVVIDVARVAVGRQRRVVVVHVAHRAGHCRRR